MDSGYEETVFLLFTCNVNRLKYCYGMPQHVLRLITVATITKV